MMSEVERLKDANEELTCNCEDVNKDNEQIKNSTNQRVTQLQQSNQNFKQSNSTL